MKEKNPKRNTKLSDKKVYIKKHHKKKLSAKDERQIPAALAQMTDTEDEALLLTDAGSSVRPTRKKAKKKKTSKRRRLKRTMIVVCSLLVAGILIAGNLGTILMWTGLGNLNNFGSDLSGNKKYQKLAVKQTLYDNLSTDINFSDTNVINILLFGLDENAAREADYSNFRPDTIMLVSINLETESIQIISIPRDTYVTIYGAGVKNKINSCFMYGMYNADSEDQYFAEGVKCLEGTVSQLLGGIPINYYIGVNMEGVPAIIDTLGGITFDVQEEVHLDGVDLYPGEQTLTGKQFMALARERHVYWNGDFGRIDTQQQLLLALFDQMTSSENIMKLPSVVSQTFDILSTDLSFKQTTTLAFTLKDYDLSKITTDTLPSTTGTYNSVSYVIILQAERVAFIKEHFGITVKQLAQDFTN